MIKPKNSLKIKNIYKQFDDGKVAFYTFQDMDQRERT